VRNRAAGRIAVSFAEARHAALALPGVEEGTSYGTPGFRVRGKFLARMWEDGETMVVKCGDLERDFRLEADPAAFFTTDHYRGYPTVLVRLPRVTLPVLKEVLEVAWRGAAPSRMVMQYDGKEPTTMRAKPTSRQPPKSKPTVATVRAYLAAVPPDQRAALQRLRKTIRSIVPKAEECISYGVPAFRFEGRVIGWYAAAAHHCSFFPGAVLAGFADELRDYETSKGTIRFQPDRPLPAPLVRKLVKARIARNAGRT
jgi:hypothetical protein